MQPDLIEITRQPAQQEMLEKITELMKINSQHVKALQQQPKPEPNYIVECGKKSTKKGLPIKCFQEEITMKLNLLGKIFKIMDTWIQKILAILHEKTDN